MSQAVATIQTTMQSVTPRAGQAGDALVLRAYQRCEWYELALMRHGFTVERLRKLAFKVANDECRRRGARLDDRMDDLVSRLVQDGLKAVLKYDPEREQRRYGNNGGEPFASYLADIFTRRTVDFWRSKAEGFGDSRYGNDRRVDIVDMSSDDYVHWQMKVQAIEEYEAHPDFERLMSEKRMQKYEAAAVSLGWTLEQFTMAVLDIASDAILGKAAA